MPRNRSEKLTALQAELVQFALGIEEIGHSLAGGDRRYRLWCDLSGAARRELSEHGRLNYTDMQSYIFESYGRHA
jgi:hypothetical protein